MTQVKLGFIRRIIAFSLVLILLFGFSACSSVKDDAAFLKNMQKGLEARWKFSNKMDEKTYASSSDYRNDLLACVNAELDKLGSFSDYEFTDTTLKGLAEAYFSALESQASGYKYYGVDDTKYAELFTKAYNERAEVIYQLCKDYSLTVSSTYTSILDEMTVAGEVYHEIRLAMLALEESVKGMSIERTGTSQYNFTLTNTCNLNFEYAELVVKGYDAKGVNTASGSGYLSNWSNGTTVTDSVWMEGEFETATAQIVVNYNYQNYTFTPVDIEVFDDLVINLDVPSTPKSVSYTSGRTETTRCNITDITYKPGDWYDGETTLHIYISGKKTYDKSGDSYSRDCYIGWKLYDESGAVIDSGTCYSGDCKVGEQFKNAEISVYGLKPGTYRLEILDVK